MKFTNAAKGQLTQSIAKMLFEHAGYRVTRLGIEELFHEVVHLEREQYLKLGLAVPLRALPDLLIATPSIDAAYLVEVKFRSEFSAKSAALLHETLSRQMRHWPKVITVLMLAESPVDKGRFHQDYIRTIDESTIHLLDSARWGRPGSADDLVQHMTHSTFNVSGARGIWQMLPALNQSFPLFGHNTTDTWLYADMITQTLAVLRKLTE